MSSIVVLGCMFGDEAKAKIVDYLAQSVDAVVRFQGGNNAGHTIQIDDSTYILHSVPSGILYPNKICLLSGGMVIDIFALLEEMKSLNNLGIDFTGRFFIDPRVHLVLPLHKQIDEECEKNLNQIKLGTTKRGIGPAYADKSSRTGIRFGDLFDREYLNLRMRNLMSFHHLSLSSNDLESQLDSLIFTGEKLKQHLIQVPYLLDELYQDGKTILFEGAQGSLLDVGFGTYPYVTSSHTIAGGIGIGCGFPPKNLNRVIGVYKSYFTRVGEGPFPSELKDKTGDQIREKGNEYGRSTGRPRRCGWFDAVAARYSAMINGIDEIALTLLDVLGGFDKLYVCKNYIYKGKKIAQFPYDLKILDGSEPDFMELPGWKEDISEIRSFDSLPKEAKNYVQTIEKLLNKRVSIISVGPKREQTILR